MLRQLLYPFLPYRSFVVPILIACAIVVPSWLGVRLYRHRTGRRAESFARECLLLIFVVYLASLVAVTLTPNRSERVRAEGTGGIALRPSLATLTCSSASLPSGSSDRAFCVRNARGNLALFVPLGLLLPLVWPSIRFWLGLRLALALSCSVELLQYVSSAWGSFRAADVNDILLNVVGAGLGLALMSLRRLRPTTRLKARN